MAEISLNRDKSHFLLGIIFREDGLWIVSLRSVRLSPIIGQFPQKNKVQLNLTLTVVIFLFYIFHGLKSYFKTKNYLHNDISQFIKVVLYPQVKWE